MCVCVVASGSFCLRIFIVVNSVKFDVYLCIASGEPPMCMSCSVLFAVKKAVEAARKEMANKDSFVLCEFIDIPITS